MDGGMEGGREALSDSVRSLLPAALFKKAPLIVPPSFGRKRCSLQTWRVIFSSNVQLPQHSRFSRASRKWGDQQLSGSGGGDSDDNKAGTSFLPTWFGRRLQGERGRGGNIKRKKEKWTYCVMIVPLSSSLPPPIRLENRIMNLFPSHLSPLLSSPTPTHA